MEKAAYIQARQNAEKELAELLDKQATVTAELGAIDLRIGQLRELIVGLSRMCDDTPALNPRIMTYLGSEGPEATMHGLAGWGLTDAIRAVLKTHHNETLLPVDVRDRLVRAGYDITKQVNILASIHTILRRLVEKGQAETANVDGKIGFRVKRGKPHKE
jgi:hypothetical protein